MQLSIDQIRTITQGAFSVEDVKGSARFHRFTEEQELLYASRAEKPSIRYTTAGIKLCLKTNSTFLKLAVDAIEATSRTYFSVDVLADDEYIGSIENFSDKETSGDYTVRPFPLGKYEKVFSLGEGIKIVTIYLPWDVELRVDALELDDDASVEPVCPDKKILVYGDSITQGYDSMYSKNRYACQIAEFLNAVEYNKAIGGEVFFPELVEVSEIQDPDYVMVAYGTNDWGKLTWEEFSKNCKRFYDLLVAKYPNATIFSLAPVWRKSCMEVRQFGEFHKIGEYIKEVTEAYENVHVIDCFELIPHDKSLFADFILHPNDKGFEYYAVNLIAKIKEIL